jgi:plastocyanin
MGTSEARTRRGWGRRVRLLAVTGAVAVAGACSTPSSTTEDEASAATDVDISAFVYQPTTLKIAVGTTVRWINDDAILHTATSGKQLRQGVPGVSEDKPARPDGAFDLDLDGKGSSASFTFDEPGTYGYFCRVHAAMTGRIVVE